VLVYACRQGTLSADIWVLVHVCSEKLNGRDLAGMTSEELQEDLKMTRLQVPLHLPPHHRILHYFT
jgi:hypothetical protein